MGGKCYIEIDWAEDKAGNQITGPVGPFDSYHEADAWMTGRVYNGEWGVVSLCPPWGAQ